MGPWEIAEAEGVSGCLCMQVTISSPRPFSLLRRVPAGLGPVLWTPEAWAVSSEGGSLLSSRGSVTVMLS